MEPLIFDKKKLKRLFDYGYNKASKGYDWLNIPLGIDKTEIFDQDDQG